jgi:hypothetical protein
MKSELMYLPLFYYPKREKLQLLLIGRVKMDEAHLMKKLFIGGAEIPSLSQFP